MIIFTFFFVFFGLLKKFNSLECDLPNCFVDHNGGDAIKLWVYESKELCTAEDSPRLLIEYERKCMQYQHDGDDFKEAIHTKCMKRGMLRVKDKCLRDTSCEECSEEKFYGPHCTFYGQDGDTKFYARVEGCEVGDDGVVMMAVGGSMMGVGIVGFICCCWICIPLGLAILLIGVCVGCCN